MMTPVQEVLNIQYAYYGARAALERINRLLKLQQEPQYPHLKNPFTGKVTVGIRLANVVFAYGHHRVLNGVSLRIRPGEKVALVGASGGANQHWCRLFWAFIHPATAWFILMRPLLHWIPKRKRVYRGH